MQIEIPDLSGSLPKLPASLTLRPLRPGDAGWIIYRHATLLAPEFGWNASFEAICARILADFIDHFQPACECSWIVERDGAILGSLFLVRQDEETAKLRLLYLEPEVRGMGLARTLLETSIAFARSRNYRRLCLFTTSNLSDARRLYARLGFMMVDDTLPAPFGEGVKGEEWVLDLSGV
jgi:GNAT superfamily N-acetyltransferase